MKNKMKNQMSTKSYIIKFFTKLLMTGAISSILTASFASDYDQLGYSQEFREESHPGLYSSSDQQLEIATNNTGTNLFTDHLLLNYKLLELPKGLA